MLTIGQSWPLQLNILGPKGDPRLSAVTKTFTLTANSNIEFIQDGVPITTVTVAAGQQSSLRKSPLVAAAVTVNGRAGPIYKEVGMRLNDLRRARPRGVMTNSRV